MFNTHKGWNFNDDKRIIAMLESGKFTNREIARKLSIPLCRTPRAIEQRIAKLQNKEAVVYQWSENDIAYLENMVFGFDIVPLVIMDKLVERFPERGFYRIRNKLRYMGYNVEKQKGSDVRKNIIKSARTTEKKDPIPMTGLNSPYVQVATMVGGSYDRETGYVTVKGKKLPESEVRRLLAQVISNRYY